MSHPYEIGKCYFIRTVTMYTVGKLKAIYDGELVLEGASWVADMGRFNEALRSGKFQESERFVEDAIVNRGAIVDITEWKHDLPE
jgi:hypothetical protein